MPKLKNTSQVNFLVSLPPSIVKQIKALAKREMRPFVSMIRILILEALEERKNAD